MPPSGDHGRNATPSSAHRSTSGSLDRNRGDSSFCTDASVVIARRLADLRGVGVADADELHLALLPQLLQRADRLGPRHLRVGPVELVEPDRLDAERPQRGLAGRAQVLAAAVERPRAVRRAGVAALGRDEHGVAVAATTTPAPWRAAARCGRPRRGRGSTRRRCRAGSRRRRARRGRCATACASSGRPSIDRGMPPRPIAPTVRVPRVRCCTGVLRRSGRACGSDLDLPLVAPAQPLGDDGVSRVARVACVPLGRWRTSRRGRRGARMGLKDVFLGWPVLKQLTGDDPLGRGAAAQSPRTAALPAPHRHRRPRRAERLPVLRRRLRPAGLRQGREGRPDRGRPRLARSRAAACAPRAAPASSS